MSAWLDRLRWRLCWLIMPRLGIGEEKRRLEKIAQECGASRSVAKGLASRYVNGLRDSRHDPRR
jgi:hypothetical protein